MVTILRVYTLYLTTSNKKNLEGVLFLIAGVLYFVAAVLYKNYINIPLGCCFFVLGISKRSKK